MKAFRTATACVLIFFIAASTGLAGKKSRKNDRVRKNEIFIAHVIRQIEEIGNTFKTVRDKRSARRAAKRIDKSLDNLLKLNAAQNKMPDLSSEENHALQKKFTGRMNAALKRMRNSALQAGKKSEGDKSFLKTMQRMISVGNKLQTTSSAVYNKRIKKQKTGKKTSHPKLRTIQRKNAKTRTIKKHRRKTIKKKHKNRTKKAHSVLLH